MTSYSDLSKDLASCFFSLMSISLGLVSKRRTLALRRQVPWAYLHSNLLWSSIYSFVSLFFFSLHFLKNEYGTSTPPPLSSNLFPARSISFRSHRSNTTPCACPRHQEEEKERPANTLNDDEFLFISLHFYKNSPPLSHRISTFPHHHPLPEPLAVQLPKTQRCVHRTHRLLLHKAFSNSHGDLEIWCSSCCEKRRLGGCGEQCGGFEKYVSFSLFLFSQFS